MSPLRSRPLPFAAKGLCCSFLKVSHEFVGRSRRRTWESYLPIVLTLRVTLMRNMGNRAALPCWRGISQPSCPPGNFQMQSPSLSTGLHQRWPSPFGSQPRHCQRFVSVLAFDREICNLPLTVTLIKRLQEDHLPTFPAESLVWSASLERDYFLHLSCPKLQEQGTLPN